MVDSGAPRSKRASGAPWVNKSTHPRKFGNHVTDRPSVCTTGIPMFSLTLSSYFGAQEKADCPSMLWSIDSCQNRVSANQRHLTVSRAQVSTHQGRVFFLKLFADNLLVFKWSQAHAYFFLKFISNMLCLCHYRPALLRFWFQTDLRRKNSASFFKIQAGKTFSYHGHVLVTLHVQFLCSDWLKFDRWVHA